MTSDSVKLDDDGIPVLENPVTLDALPAQAGEPLPDLTDHEVVARLLQNIDVITEMLQFTNGNGHHKGNGHGVL